MTHAFGPTLTKHGVTFRAWAPAARSLQLILNPAGPQEHTLSMERESDGYFSLSVDDAGHGSRYFLRADDNSAQPDPASPFQPDGIWAASEVIDHRFAWQDQKWRGIPADEVILYEVHVGTFSSDGTYRGLVDRLDHLRHVGINTIKLMPLATFPGRRNWGYDGVFHMAPHPNYGRPEQLQALVNACHLYGIAVYLDVVTNHFGPQGNAMWTLARRFFGRTNNTPWGPGPRFDREPVLAYFDQMVRHFRRHYHVDGFRLDAFDTVPQEHRPEHLRHLVTALEGEISADSHATIMLESTANELSLLRLASPGVSVTQLDFDFQRSTHRLLTGESHSRYSDYIDAADELARCMDGGFAMLERFSKRRNRIVGEPPRPVEWPTVVNYIQNHDTAGNRYLGQRLQSLLDERTHRAALAFLLLQPGVPYLLMGDEWATQKPFLFFCNYGGDFDRRIAAARKRGFEAFEFGDGSRVAPDPHDPEAFAQSTLDWTERHQPYHREMLAFVRRLLALRRELAPQMTRSSRGTRAQAHGELLSVEIGGRTEPATTRFQLVTNLGDTPAVVELAAFNRSVEIAYATDDADSLRDGLPSEARLPAKTTALFLTRPSRQPDGLSNLDVLGIDNEPV